MNSIRRLERLLGFCLAWIIVASIWAGSSLEDPTDHRLVAYEAGRGGPTSVVEQRRNSTNLSLHHSSTYLWTSNARIPDWMKEYMDWHTSVVSTLNVGNWQQYRYLILRCYRKDERCGGVSDRLKPVPLVLLAAQRSKRIVFIDWDRPFALTEFLVPPIGGFQWNAPSFLIPIFQETAGIYVLTRAANLIDKSDNIQATLLATHIHDTLGGATQYDEEFGKGSFQQIYHDLFRILFQPSLAVQRLVNLHLIQNNRPQEGDIAAAAAVAAASKGKLVEGEYTVAHYRAEYGREVQRHPKLTEPSFLRKVAINALRCASDLKPGAPIYFASDNVEALQLARQLASKTRYPIITFERSEDTPLKLDAWNGTFVPSDFYSTFVDLYLAGSGACVSHGRGGFGRFAALLSFNVSCSSKHVKQFFPVPCVGQPPFRARPN